MIKNYVLRAYVHDSQFVSTFNCEAYIIPYTQRIWQNSPGCSTKRLSYVHNTQYLLAPLSLFNHPLYVYTYLLTRGYSKLSH